MNSHSGAPAENGVETGPKSPSLPPGASPAAWAVPTEAPRPYDAGDPTIRSHRADPALKTASARRTAVSLGRQLHALRTARGLTQQQAADLVGWDQPQWARLEAGRVYPTLATLDLLVSRLAVRIVLTPDASGLQVAIEPLSAAA
ncbi:MAG: helix-turn-helix transcriptional regulator [Chloroflexota bacterium]